MIRIKEITINPIFNKAIKRLETTSIIHSDRSSWIIKIITSDGFVGYGEASPLPIFNEETFDTVGYALEGFKLALNEVVGTYGIVVMCKDCGYETTVADWGKHHTCDCRRGDEE